MNAINEDTPAGPAANAAMTDVPGRQADPEPSAACRRPLASYETGFWAFLEYPSFWIPAFGFMVFMLAVLTFLMVRG